MKQFIAFDSHKHYTLASVEDEKGRLLQETRIQHARGALRDFLRNFEPGSPVAVETIGSWYWIVDEIEQAGCVPRLVHARKAKLMMGMIDKTDKLDARGLNRLQRTGALPTVWIPPGRLRDLRELPRTRMVLVRQRSRLKNRIHSTLAKYGLKIEEVTDIFGRRGRKLLEQIIKELPPQTRYATEVILGEEEDFEFEIRLLEKRIEKCFKKDPKIKLLMTLPGVGFTLAVVIALEVGQVDRFPRAANLASYSGLVPRVHASGGRIRHGRVHPDVNRYLKWAFVEAGNSVCRHRVRYPDRHVTRLYRRVARAKGHSKATVAVGRHLAEATYWMLSKGERYRDPGLNQVSSTEAPAR
jgi:transposase